MTTADGTARELARLCRMAASLAREVRDSRWEGISPPPATARPARPVGPALDEIGRQVSGCTKCSLSLTRTNTVFGEGDPKASLMFVGEGPGGEEDRLGRPFVGKAGRLLDNIISAMGLKREQVFIANIIKCRPPGNRDPRPEEIAACMPYLHAQMDIIRPTVICALGKFAAQSLLQTRDPISRMRGRFHEYRGIKLMPTFHPAYLLRNPGDKGLAWQDVQQIMAVLGMSAEEKKQ